MTNLALRILSYTSRDNGEINGAFIGLMNDLHVSLLPPLLGTTWQHYLDIA